MTDDLAAMAAFAEARLAEDEAAAKRASREKRSGDEWAVDQGSWAFGTGILAPDGSGVAVAIGDYAAHHIGRHDPARALREVKAQRKILAEHKAVIRLAGLTEQELGFLGWYREWVLKNLIAAWNDHPDYLPGWAPEAVGG